MRILHWTELYRPAGGDHELLTEQLIGSLHARGHENIVVTSHVGSALADTEQRGPARVHRFRFHHALLSDDPAAVDEVGRAVSDLITSVAPDVIHVHTLRPSLYFLDAAAQRAWPTIFTVHDPSAARGGLPARVLARADAAVTTSHAGLHELRRHVPSLESRSHAIVAGLAPTARRLPPQQSYPLLAAAGRMTSGSGFEVLLRAMPSVLRVFPQARLQIAGDGRERASLAALAEELGVAGDVDLLGWISQGRVEDLLARSHVVVAPSQRADTLGLVALQAAQVARPVVACAAGALPSIVVDGVTGSVVPPTDSHALAWSIIELLAHPDRAVAFGRAARDRVEREHAMPAMINGYEELYAQLARERRRQVSRARSDRPVLMWEGMQSGYSALSYCNSALAGALVDTAAVDLRIVSNQRTWPDLDARPELQRLRRLDSAVAGLPLGEAGARPSIWVRHQFPLGASSPGRLPWVAFQSWEYSRVPTAMVETLDRCREVWVPSVFSADAMRRSGVCAPVEVVPYGVDTTLFAPEGKRFSLPHEDAFRFLFVGASIYRKGLDVLLTAYARAFGRTDNVLLVVKDVGVGSLYEGYTSGERVESFAGDRSNPRVAYLDGRLPAASLASLYRSCHAFVCAYRGEGFCLPALEAMASGLPVVVTAGGATDDFVDETVGWRIPSRPRYVGRSVYGQATSDDVYLLEPDADTLAALMRECFERRDEVRRRGQAALERAASWTWQHSARRVLERVGAMMGAGAAAQR